MTKSFRKYNKWLLAIFGSLLLVTWLVQGTAGQFQPDPGKRIVATMGPGDEKVRAKDLGHADLEFRALSELAPMALRVPSPRGMGVENGTHWYLLTREAQDAGLVGEAGDGVDWLPDLAKVETQLRLVGQYGTQILQFMERNPQMMSAEFQRTTDAFEKGKDAVGRRSNLKPHEMDLALAKLRGVYRLTQAHDKAARMSDLQLTREAREIMTQASFDCVIIPPDSIVATLPAPSPEALKDLFDKYKGVKPGTGEFGFGYLRPQRIKLEWLTLSKQAISAALKLDPIAVNKYFLEHRDEFKGDFAAEKSKVEEKLRGVKVENILDEADRAYRVKIRSATRKLETTAGIRKLPADWESLRPRMETIAQELVAAVEQATKIRMPLPTVEVRASEFIPLNDLKALGRLSATSFSVGGKQGSFGELLATTYELSPAGGLGLQVGVPFEFPVTEAGSGDRTYFTVLDAKGESPAESLDEVLPAVTRDAKLLAAFEKLKSEAPTYQALAVTDGLEGVAKLFATAPAAGSEPQPLPILRRVVVSRQQGDYRYPQLDSQALRDSVMATLHELGPDMRATPENLALRTLAEPLPAKCSLVILQITGQRPVSVEDVRLLGDREVGVLLERELRDAAPDSKSGPFSLSAVKQRWNYKAAAGESDKPEDQQDQAPEPKKPA